MADREWFQVETPQGAVLALNDRIEFANKESAADAARQLMLQGADPVLLLVKHTRKEIKTFTRRQTIDEADIPTA